ncbi:MAG: hypothetical protein ACREUQ_07430 [Burkholderiales bacterium]
MPEDQYQATPSSSEVSPASDTSNSSTNPPSVGDTGATTTTPAAQTIAPDDTAHPNYEKWIRWRDVVPDSTLDYPYGFKADGTPRAKPSGFHYRKAGVEAIDPTSIRPNPNPRKVTQAITPPQVVAVNYDAMGKIAASAWFGGGTMILGKEWEPNDQTEANAVASAFSDYFKSKGITNIDPGWGLVIVLGSYTATRVHRPTIRQRISGAWQWMKRKVQTPLSA